MGIPPLSVTTVRWLPIPASGCINLEELYGGQSEMRMEFSGLGAFMLIERTADKTCETTKILRGKGLQISELTTAIVTLPIRDLDPSSGFFELRK